MRVQHPIFHTPFEVELTLEERPVSSSYPTRASGRNLGETMPMWRVQTEGYLDEKGMLIGVVTPAALEDSPDGEFISGGLNTKGSDSVAIGRQGNFLHWGFAASPTYMTEEAKLVFVNALHYISKFDGHRAFVEKKGYMTRGTIDDVLYGLSDEGFAAWQKLIAESNAQREKMADEIRAKQARGEQLSNFEAQILNAPPSAEWTRERGMYGVPQTVKNRFGDDWNAYVTHFTENRPYLYPVENALEVDEDAKALGIANDDMALLDRCVAMLEERNDRERAMRLLLRYTTEALGSAAEWRAWLDENRSRLFFTEMGGFKWMVDVNHGLVVAATTGDALGTAIEKLAVAAPSPDEPVRMAAALVPAAAAPGETVTLVVKARIFPGWHIYAHVPQGLPYVNTTFQLDVGEGLSPVGNWKLPRAHAYPAIAGVNIFEGECVFTHELRVDAASKTPRVTAAIGYQTCDVNMCLPPTTVEFPLTLTSQ